MRNLRLHLEYDGSAYAGWQVQPDRPTVQGTVQAALARLTGGPVKVVGAARTDAGVHALGQVGNFRTESRHSCATVHRALNALLPRDIAVREVTEVPHAFDARRSATGKTYRYALLVRPDPSPLHRAFSLHVPPPLDVPAMAKAAAALLGRHDFSAFRSASCEAAHPVRSVWEARFLEEPPCWHFVVSAEAFLQHMVRSILGTLLEVGRGKRAPDEVAAILASRDRARAGPTAPAHGLCLMRVHYGERGPEAA
ncbi:MAG TPA: tRNA pseudouridine(38-40) synthase TruA [Candidatus Methylomirabilis sp.]|nr:tRNA pseudouridine(38-40) synthase TruA [Candidatus Methylomirabilis sp.]